MLCVSEFSFYYVSWVVQTKNHGHFFEVALFGLALFEVVLHIAWILLNFQKSWNLCQYQARSSESFFFVLDFNKVLDFEIILKCKISPHDEKEDTVKNIGKRLLLKIVWLFGESKDMNHWPCMIQLKGIFLSLICKERFRPLWTCLDKFEQVLTTLDKFKSGACLYSKDMIFNLK